MVLPLPQGVQVAVVPPGQMQHLPYRLMGKVTFTNAQGQADHGTGIVIGPSTILTAGHCAIDRQTGQQHANLRFVPATSSANVAPFGTWNVNFVSVSPRFRSNPYMVAWDVAALRLDPNAMGQTIGAVLGNQYYAVNIPTAPQGRYRIYGYPGVVNPYGLNFNGLDLWRCDGAWIYDGTLQDRVFVSSVLNGGASGGPWFTMANGIPGSLVSGISAAAISGDPFNPFVIIQNVSPAFEPWLVDVIRDAS